MSRRRPMSTALLVALVCLLVVVPIAEVFVLIKLGQWIGGWWVVGLLVAEAALGAWLIRREGSKAWRALSGAFNQGRMPSRELADGALVLTGGLMLMLPGLITDVVGLICLLPFTRPLARGVIAWVAARQAQRHGLDLGNLRATTSRLGQGNVVPGEVVDDATPPSEGEHKAIEGRIID